MKNILKPTHVFDEINNLYFQIIDFCNSIKKFYQVQIFIILTSDLFTIIHMILTAFQECVSKSIAGAAILFCVVDPLIRILLIVFIIRTTMTTTLQVSYYFYQLFYKFEMYINDRTMILLLNNIKVKMKRKTDTIITLINFI